ncbi:hypothetical protein N7468_006370 [Penicillium chermesinum]|uniref:Chromosome segregation in meiosis protein n=1 Tax=Penicillium chermesinum TaxID=63820 RepID=A0A9W9NS71_9EURO|nr:uncharacterized protein N7468_006370 [Penicillium chermesinum]KAJ5225145.1 hypothetical protein N7468_006370 [Penicillium chermesinum]KAJ6140459.1 hypothetical protein N7470_010255 [Penicillium chermesinum]
MDTSAEHMGSPSGAHDLFDYDLGLDDILEENDTAPTDASKPTGDLNSLGLDEEVKVTKKRQPVAKLDEGRLLSQSGIPKLRQTAKQKLRFKGKGHEFSDAARLLNFYQLWLDDLFPRAKFADGLAMVEKLGHTKRIQTMRREWIDEEKRKIFEDSEPLREDPMEYELPTRSADDDNGIDRGIADSSELKAASERTGEADPDLFVSDPEAAMQAGTNHPEADGDDLEDLLREQEQDGIGPGDPRPKGSSTFPDEFDAEYEVMNDLGM